MQAHASAARSCGRRACVFGEGALCIGLLTVDDADHEVLLTVDAAYCR